MGTCVLGMARITAILEYIILCRGTVGHTCLRQPFLQLLNANTGTYTDDQFSIQCFPHIIVIQYIFSHLWLDTDTPSEIRGNSGKDEPQKDDRCLCDVQVTIVFVIHV